MNAKKKKKHINDFVISGQWMIDDSILAKIGRQKHTTKKNKSELKNNFNNIASIQLINQTENVLHTKMKKITNRISNIRGL